MDTDNTDFEEQQTEIGRQILEEGEKEGRIEEREGLGLKDRQTQRVIILQG